MCNTKPVRLCFPMSLFLNVGVSTYIYTRMYVCIYRWIHTYIGEDIYVCVWACIYIYICVCACVYLCMYVCMCVQTHENTNVDMWVNIYTHICA
eukprot:NODE_6730_length_438_cov_9.143959_g5146_i0.p2 GENE.NODE_6730_length_438_cov_9.143959_g5146_i0~~NODE_6730_length_438_cov_9.143959_g5146_i0.p2  ORF type:complete len:106 (+),score=8.99 NODE_6730_length_438_cov_9.143959_g5146_i0:39-320(+)